MTKKKENLYIGFEAQTIEQKDKMKVIAKENSRTLAGQLNHMMNECIKEHESKAVKS